MAVSYTHLDVYKRQGQGGAHQLFFRGASAPCDVSGSAEKGSGDTAFSGHCVYALQYFYSDIFHDGKSSGYRGAGCVDRNFVGVRCAVLEESFRGNFPVWRVSDEKMDIL